MLVVVLYFDDVEIVVFGFYVLIDVDVVIVIVGDVGGMNF